MKKILLLFYITTFVFSCKEKENNTESNNVFNLSGEIFLTSELIEYSYNMALYGDYLIILNFRGNDVIRIYDKKTSDLIFSGVEFGEGPSQILMPISISVNEENGNILVYDVAKLRYIEIDLEQLLSKNYVHFEKSISVPHLGDNVYPVFQFGNDYLGITFNLNKYVFSFNSNGETLDTLSKYEKVKEDLNIPNIMYGIQFDGRYSLDSKNNNLIKGYLHKNVVSILNLKTGKEDEILNFEPQDFNDFYNESSGRFELDEDRLLCYISSKNTIDNYYFLYSGVKMDEVEDVVKGGEIHIINKRTLKLTKLILDYEISDFSIDENERMIYGINFTLDNPILKFSY